MILISHRGNINGRNVENENKPSYISSAINSGYDVEIDLRLVEGGLFLGHDEAQTSINEDFIMDFRRNLWIHCKDIESFTYVLNMNDPNINCFYHNDEDYVLTSKKYIWTYPGKKIIPNRTIAVLPETKKKWDITNAIGICSDVIIDYK